MHPDAIIAGLRRELDRLDPDAADHADRKKAIEAEIKRVDGLDRPEATAEEPTTVIDHNVAYLAGLKRELARVGEEARKQVEAEIKRVEALIHKSAKEADVDKPSAEEIEQRKQARAGQKVERAVNEPGGRPAPANAPKGAKE